VRVLAGEEVSPDEWSGALDRLTSSLRQLAAVAGEYGVMLVVENHMDTMATSAVKTVSICEATACDNVRILFDPANLATLEAEDFLQGFRLQRDWIAHVHVKDAIVDRGSRRSVVPGEGRDPWPTLFSEIQASGYHGDFAIEYERRWLPDLPAAEDALPQAKLFIERYLTEGRPTEI
jgi:sugar phosphate isomerase/epimerase